MRGISPLANPTTTYRAPQRVAAQRGLRVRAADGVDHHVDTAVGELLDAAPASLRSRSSPVATAPFSRHCSSLSSLDAAATTRAPEHGCELDRRQPHAAGGAEHEDPLPRFQFPDAAQRVVRGCVATPNAAAASKLRPFGIGRTDAAGTAICSANTPTIIVAMTRSPTRGVVTPSPTADTTPANSLPGVNGGGTEIWYSFDTIERVGEIQCGRDDVDDDLTRARCRHRQVLDHEVLERARAAGI